MSVMLLAHTEDGLGYGAWTHDPVFHVYPNGIEKEFDESSPEDDPRYRSFSNSDGSVIGAAWGEGWYYKPGLLNGATEEQTNNPNDPRHPDERTDQMLYILRCKTKCYAGGYSCSAEINPSLDYEKALPERSHTFGGWGSIELEFSKVCYHQIVGFWTLRCEERERKKQTGVVEKQFLSGLLWVITQKREQELLV